MIFLEKKEEDHYKYTVTDIFGEIEIKSPDRIVKIDETGNANSDLLDDVFMSIFRAHEKDTAKEISGIIKDTDISYTYIKKGSGWDDIFDDKCIKFIERVFNMEFDDISQKRRDLFAAWYMDNCYRLTKEFKNKVKKEKQLIINNKKDE